MSASASLSLHPQMHEQNETGVPEKPYSPSNTGFFSRAYLLGPVKRDHGDLALLACCLATGLVDAASFSNWGVFVGMQTGKSCLPGDCDIAFVFDIDLLMLSLGNTVILGLSTSGLPANPHAWLTTLVSIVSFLLGAFATFHISEVFAPTDPYSNRLVIVSLFFIQSLLIIIAAALVTAPGLVPQNLGSTGRTTLDPPNALDHVNIVTLLPPLAIQSGMQIASSRLLGYNELPVNVLTSTYCDIMGDYKLFALNNVKRNRRVAAVVLLLAGAICIGWMMRSSGGLKSVLWLAGGIKCLTAATILLFMPAAELLRRVRSRQ